MGRGIHETTKIKKEIKLTTKTAAAIEKAKRDLDRKNLWKDLPLDLKDALLKMVSNIDPLEVAATIGTTIVIKNLIDTSEAVRGAIKAATGLEDFDLINSIVNPGWGVSIWIFNLITGKAPTDINQEEIIEKAKSFEGLFPDWMDWLIAFSFAYMLVKYGDSIFGGVTNISTFIMGFLT